MAAVGALGSTARLGCLVRLSTQLGRERSSNCSLFKNNLRLLSHTLALNRPAYDRREDDVASTEGDKDNDDKYGKDGNIPDDDDKYAIAVNGVSKPLDMGDD